MISDMNGENNSQKSLSLPSLTALRCFEVAARTEHFGRAADELHLTHGAISRAVRLLAIGTLHDTAQRRLAGVVHRVGQTAEGVGLEAPTLPSGIIAPTPTSVTWSRSAGCLLSR